MSYCNVITVFHLKYFNSNNYELHKQTYVKMYKPKNNNIVVYLILNNTNDAIH